MRFATVLSRGSYGINAPPINIEVHLSNGLPKFLIVGMPETAVRESKERVRSAIINSHLQFPIQHITVNLAPADIPKEGSRFDLPIALGILAASEQLPPGSLANYEFAGELALSGELRPIKGMLAFALAAKKEKATLVIPQANANEASLAEQVTILPAKHLLDIVAHCFKQKPLACYDNTPKMNQPVYPDLRDIQGQTQACRALEIAAAGGHHLLMIGPPGTGKTMLANRFPGLLPPLTNDEALETAILISLDNSGYFPLSEWGIRPFRIPHHTASHIALVGGSSPPRPGEISKSHHGVLFLDELMEFKQASLEALREPLESGTITITRAASAMTFPAKFQLIAAMNPCPCGYLNSFYYECRCTSQQIQRYQNRLSGPLLDRIDLSVTVPQLPIELLKTTRPSESSDTVRQRVIACRQHQYQQRGTLNRELHHPLLINQLTNETTPLFMTRCEKLSMRSKHQVLRVARTIADLDHSETITENHLAEALSYQQPYYLGSAISA